MSDYDWNACLVFLSTSLREVEALLRCHGWKLRIMIPLSYYFCLAHVELPYHQD